MRETFEELLYTALREVGLEHAVLCRAERVAAYLTREIGVDFPVRSVVFTALPYGGKAGRIARYARGRDYHRVLPERLDCAAKAVQKAFPELRYKSFADISPYREVAAAEAAGLGIQLRNRLLWVSGCGTYCLIGETVFNLPTGEEEVAIGWCPKNREKNGECLSDVRSYLDAGGAFCTANTEKSILFSSGGVEEACSPQNVRGNTPCTDCGRCARACPTGVLRGETDYCLSALTQTRRELSEREREFIRQNGSIWGCDICQQVCPCNEERPGEECPDLRELKGLSDRQFRKKYADQAFSYRGIKPLLRNMELLEEEEK